MKVGFYYHSPLSARDGGFYLPGYIGVFVDALAAEVEGLRLFLHRADGNQVKSADYRLQSANIEWIDLGPKTPAWHRSLFHAGLLKRIGGAAEGVDILLVRGPTPLAPYFGKMRGLKAPIAYMVVGDYGEGAAHMAADTIRSRVVGRYLQWNDRRFKHALRGQLVLVNSRELHRTYADITQDIYEVRTTTLSKDTFFERADTCQGASIRLLFTGRIVRDKGLRELLQAAHVLMAEGLPIQVDLVGWEDDPARPMERELGGLAHTLGIGERVHFHGFKRLGAELNERYRMADVYVLPSYHEGFPRTIWEAMANGLPVVATSVGSIPDFLSPEEHALLVRPKDVQALAAAIRRVVEEGDLRRSLIRNGSELAMEMTLDTQSRRLVDILAARLGRAFGTPYTPGLTPAEDPSDGRHRI